MSESKVNGYEVKLTTNAAEIAEEFLKLAKSAEVSEKKVDNLGKSLDEVGKRKISITPKINFELDAKSAKVVEATAKQIQGRIDKAFKKYRVSATLALPETITSSSQKRKLNDLMIDAKSLGYTGQALDAINLKYQEIIKTVSALTAENNSLKESLSSIKTEQDVLNYFDRLNKYYNTRKKLGDLNSELPKNLKLTDSYKSFGELADLPELERYLARHKKMVTDAIYQNTGFVDSINQIVATGKEVKNADLSSIVNSVLITDSTKLLGKARQEINKYAVDTETALKKIKNLVTRYEHDKLSDQGAKDIAGYYTSYLKQGGAPRKNIENVIEDLSTYTIDPGSEGYSKVEHTKAQKVLAIQEAVKEGILAQIAEQQKLNDIKVSTYTIEELNNKPLEERLALLKDMKKAATEWNRIDTAYAEVPGNWLDNISLSSKMTDLESKFNPYIITVKYGDGSEGKFDTAFGTPDYDWASANEQFRKQIDLRKKILDIKFAEVTADEIAKKQEAERIRQQEEYARIYRANTKTVSGINDYLNSPSYDSLYKAWESVRDQYGLDIAQAFFDHLREDSQRLLSSDDLKKVQELGSEFIIKSIEDYAKNLGGDKFFNIPEITESVRETKEAIVLEQKLKETIEATTQARIAQRQETKAIEQAHARMMAQQRDWDRASINRTLTGLYPGNSSVESTRTVLSQLKEAHEAYDLSIKNSWDWESQYEWAVRFTSLYEQYAGRDNGTAKSLAKHTELYNQLLPNIATYKTDLQAVLDFKPSAAIEQTNAALDAQIKKYNVIAAPKIKLPIVEAQKEVAQTTEAATQAIEKQAKTIAQLTVLEPSPNATIIRQKGEAGENSSFISWIERLNEFQAQTFTKGIDQDGVPYSNIGELATDYDALTNAIIKSDNAALQLKHTLKHTTDPIVRKALQDKIKYHVDESSRLMTMAQMVGQSAEYVAQTQQFIEARKANIREQRLALNIKDASFNAGSTKTNTSNAILNQYNQIMATIKEITVASKELGSLKIKVDSNPLTDYTQNIDFLEQKVQSLSSSLHQLLSQDFIKKNADFLGTDRINAFKKAMNTMDIGVKGANDDLIKRMQQSLTSLYDAELKVMNLSKSGLVDTAQLNNAKQNVEACKTAYQELAAQVEQVYGKDMQSQAIANINSTYYDKFKTVLSGENSKYVKQMNSFKDKLGDGFLSNIIKEDMIGTAKNLAALNTEFEMGAQKALKYGHAISTIQVSDNLNKMANLFTGKMDTWQYAWGQYGGVEKQLSSLSGLAQLEKYSDVYQLKLQELQQKFQYAVTGLLNGSFIEKDATGKIIGDRTGEIFSNLQAQIESFKLERRSLLKFSKPDGGLLDSASFGKIHSIEDATIALQNYATQLGGLKAYSKPTEEALDKVSQVFVDQQGKLHKLTATMQENNAVRLKQDFAGYANIMGDWGVAFGGFAKQLASYYTGYQAFTRIISQAREGLNVLKQYDAALTDMSYSMNVTEKDLDRLGSSAVEMAKDLSTSLEDTLGIYQIYANMNTSIQEIEDTAKPTAILSNLGGIDALQASDQIQGVLQQFNMIEEGGANAAEASMHVVDVFDNIASNVSIDYVKGMQTISEAVTATGSVAYDAGMSFEQLAAVTAKVAERTREDGSTIGNAIKTIVTRISKVGKMPAYADEVSNEELSKASEALNEIGIAVYNTDGSFREFDVILTELRDKWDGLTDAQQANLSFQIAA